MDALASSRRIFAVGLLLLGMSRANCEAPEAAPTNSFPKLKTLTETGLAKTKPADRLKGLVEIAQTLSLNEIPDALRAATSLQQLREQAVFQEAVLKRWSELSPRDAFVYIAALPESRVKVEAMRSAANRFANRNCEEAANAVEKLAPGRAKNEAVEMIAGIWARKNVKEALGWADKLPEGFARESALNSIRFVWVHSDPVSASRHVDKLLAGDTKNALLTNIAGEWAAFDPQGALGWARGLSDGPEKDLVIANIAESWADSDPTAAAAFALTLSGSLKLNAANGVVSRWATQNPEAALNWALKTKERAIQDHAFSEALNLWASIDAGNAGRWVKSLASGLLRESAIQSYIEAVVTWEPSEAIRLANTLQDESARIQQVEKCLRRWIELDQSSARKWIASSTLPEEFKSKWIVDNERRVSNQLR